MDKIWFIEVNGKPEGPFSLQDLKLETRITPDTLVWREGFANWIAMRKVAELKEVFEDTHKPNIEEEDEENAKAKAAAELAGKDELAISMQNDIPPFVWIMLIALAITYLMYWLFKINE